MHHFEGARRTMSGRGLSPPLTPCPYPKPHRDVRGHARQGVGTQSSKRSGDPSLSRPKKLALPSW